MSPEESGTSRTTPPALAVSNLSKTFGGARALNNVKFHVERGEVHGLLGHNGSGKSTLVKVLSGYHDPDPGATLSLGGKTLTLPFSPGAFRSLGLSFVHQNLGLVPSLTVLENLRVGQITGKGRVHISWSQEARAARNALERFGIDIDIDARIATLSLGDRALLAIIRAFEELETARTAHGNPGVLVLDEPTPFLPRESVERLFNLIRGVTANGTSVVFISHDIDEILEITDRATILRNGSVIGTLDTRKAGRDDVVEMIVGHKLERGTRSNKASGSVAPRVRVRGLHDVILAPTDFEIGKGEILGITGLIGSGFERVAALLFGSRKASAGTLELDDKTIDLDMQSPRRAVSSRIAFLPSDRNYASGVGSLTITENMMLPDLNRYFRNGLLNRKGLLATAKGLGQRYDVRPDNPLQKLSNLSGGNAQKVLLAKWLNMEPGLLLLDEPTQGVDVGSREQVYAAIRIAVSNGTSVLCASSDHEQLADLCDRVLVFSRGRIVTEISGAALSKAEIAAQCYGAPQPQNSPSNFHHIGSPS